MRPTYVPISWPELQPDSADGVHLQYVVGLAQTDKLLLVDRRVVQLVPYLPEPEVERQRHSNGPDSHHDDRIKPEGIVLGTEAASRRLGHEVPEFPSVVVPALEGLANPTTDGWQD